MGFPAPDGKTRKIRLRKTGQMEGLVVDESGQPIAGAQVRATLFSDERSDDPDVLGCKALDWFAVRTGKDGRFVVSGVPTEFMAEFVVRAVGRATVATQRLHPLMPKTGQPPQFRPGQENIRIVLPPQCRIEGVAMDKSTGKPVAGVHLIALGGHLTPPAIAMTDKHGRFVLDALGPGRWTVALAQQCMIDRVEPGPWVAPPVVTNLAAGKSQPIQFELSRGELVEVALVHAATGRPIRGCLRGWRPETWRKTWAPQVSNDKGIVRMRLLPGHYTFLACDWPSPIVYENQEAPMRFRGRVNLTVEPGKSQRVLVPLVQESATQTSPDLEVLDDSDHSTPSSGAATQSGNVVIDVHEGLVRMKYGEATLQAARVVIIPATQPATRPSGYR